MAENEILTSNIGAVWAQPDGPNTIPYLMLCYEAGDVTEPMGEIVRTRCQDPRHPGQWKVVSTRVGPADYPSGSLAGLLGKTRDWLQRATANKSCPLGLYNVWSECGPRDMFAQYDAVKVIEGARINSKGQGGLSSREGTDDSTLSWDYTAEKIEMIYPLSDSLKVTTEDKGILDITSCNDVSCLGGCGPAADLCDKLYAVTNGAVADAADLMVSANGGDTWTIAAANPFAVAENIGAVVCFKVSRTTTRVLVTRATTDAGNPAEVAYSDDDGATWVLVNVNATNATFFPWSGSLYAMDMYHIWAGIDTGILYFSDNGGVTWTLQTAAPATDIRAIHFADENLGILGGDTNMIFRTEDGGDNWIAVVGPAAQAAVNVLSLCMIDRYRWFVGYQDGEIWYTHDGGTTWAQRVIPVPAGVTAIARINDIKAWDEYILFAAADGTVGANHFPVILRSWDGGYTWEGYVGDQQDAGTPLGAEAIQVCSANSAIAVGDLDGAVGQITAVSD